MLCKPTFVALALSAWLAHAAPIPQGRYGEDRGGYGYHNTNSHIAQKINPFQYQKPTSGWKRPSQVAVESASAPVSASPYTLCRQ